MFRLMIFCAVLSLASSNYLRIPLKKNRILKPLLQQIQLEHSHLRQKYGMLSQIEVDGVENMIDNNDKEYFGSIGIGTPSQEIYVLFDTTYSGLFVAKDGACLLQSPNSSICEQHINGFNASTSCSFVSTGTKVTSTIDGAVWSGIVGRDVVQLAGFEINNLAFGLAKEVGVQLTFQGYFGLGLQNSSPIYDMWQEKVIKDPVVSFYLSYVTPFIETLLGGEIIFGGSDSNLFDGNLTYVSVTSEYYWQFEVDSISVEGWYICESCKANIDTSSRWIMAPKPAFAEFNTILNATNIGDGIQLVDCSNLYLLPDLVFIIGGRTLTLSSKYYIGQDYSFYSTKCYSLVGESLDDTWILGNSIVAAFYTEFDFGNKRIGFAPAKPLN